MTNPQANCKAAMLEVIHQEGNASKKRCNHDKPKNRFESPWA
jgi:hypothetical protein